MSDIFSRLAQGPQSMQPQDYNDWNQMIGSSPHDQVHSAMTNSLRQVDNQDYYNHVQPGVGGTDPLGGLQQPQRAGLIQSILGTLFGHGINPQTVQQVTGAQSLDPNSMSNAQLATLLQWVKQNHPELLGSVAAQYQNQPDLLHSILGNKGLMLAIGALGLKLLYDQHQRSQAQPGVNSGGNFGTSV